MGSHTVSEKKKDPATYLQTGLVEQINDAVIATDSNFNIVSFNRAAEKIYQIKKEEFSGYTFYIYVIPFSDLDETRKAIIGELLWVN